MRRTYARTRQAARPKEEGPQGWHPPLHRPRLALPAFVGAPCPRLKRQHVPKSPRCRPFSLLCATRAYRSSGVPFASSTARAAARKPAADIPNPWLIGVRAGRPSATRFDGDAPDGAKVVDQHDVHGLTLGQGMPNDRSRSPRWSRVEAALLVLEWPLRKLCPAGSWCGFCPNANACVQTHPAPPAALAPRKNLVVMNGEEQGHVSAKVGHTDRHRSTSPGTPSIKVGKSRALCVKRPSQGPGCPNLAIRGASFIRSGARPGLKVNTGAWHVLETMAPPKASSRPGPGQPGGWPSQVVDGSILRRGSW
ncbi:MAG: hypothetical protein CM15mP18_2980 [Methanobacteriota archaeon]|nr:MAG: hypothetical protein CM15mP18_2980 [Euryarchaeota archaeon]